MSILVAYASKYGATRGIAERIADKLRQMGKDVDLRPAGAVDDVGADEAIVIGSAVYSGSWLPEAAEFVRSHSATLAVRPVWLFSSGPLGADVTSRRGRGRDRMSSWSDQDIRLQAHHSLAAAKRDYRVSGLDQSARS